MTALGVQLDAVQLSCRSPGTGSQRSQPPAQQAGIAFLSKYTFSAHTAAHMHTGQTSKQNAKWATLLQGHTQACRDIASIGSNLVAGVEGVAVVLVQRRVRQGITQRQVRIGQPQAPVCDQVGVAALDRVDAVLPRVAAGRYEGALSARAKTPASEAAFGELWGLNSPQRARTSCLVGAPQCLAVPL